MADPSWIGRSFEGRYRIESQLGSGGVGRVYRARHLRLDRPVALKVLHKQHNERWVSRQRFDREARALGQLSHPHIVAVTDFGIEGDVPFLVMELLNGQDLTAVLRGGALPPLLACRYALQLLDGLGFVHGHGLVHRDIKPGNVFLERAEGRTERVKLLDFGLARLVVPSGDASVSRHGEVLGTPAYMAPEQITGESVDARTDVYAVALLLYEMVAGRRAFAGSESEVLRQQLAQPLPLLHDSARGREPLSRLDDVIQRAAEKEPSQRFPDAQAMAAALAAVADALGSSTRHGSRRAASGRTPAHARPTRSPRRRRLGGLLRASAVLISCVALLAILVAAAVIYLLTSPAGDEWRALLQRALSALDGSGSGRSAHP